MAFVPSYGYARAVTRGHATAHEHIKEKMVEQQNTKQDPKRAQRGV